MNNKEERIVHSAIAVFRDKGIEKSKVSDIVKGAGIAQGTFYLYFTSKLAVMPAIAEVMVEKILGEIKERADGLETFKEQLDEVIDIVFRLTEADRDIFALMYSGLAATEYLKDWESIYHRYYEWMGEQLERAVEREEIGHEICQYETATLLIGLIESAAEQTYLYSKANEEEIQLKKSELLKFATHALSLKVPVDKK